MKKILQLLAILLIINQLAIAQSVTIDPRNTTGTTPNIIDVKSDNQGIVIPRMTTIQKNAIANKVEGLMVYDTDLKQFSYWKAVTGPVALGYWQDFGNPPSIPPSVWNTNVNDIENANSGGVLIGKIVGGGSFPSTSSLDVQANSKNAMKIIQVGPYKGLEIQSGTSNNVNPVLDISNSTRGYGGYFRSSNPLGKGVYSLLEDASNNASAIEGLTFGTGNGGYFSSSLGYALVTGTGNVGIGVASPSKAKLEIGTANTTTAIFGTTSTGISLQQNFPTIGFNQYRDGNNIQRYIGTGYAMGNFMAPTNGNMYWNAIPTGTAGNATPSETTIMTLTNTGNLGVGTDPFVKFHVKYGSSGITPYGIAGFESNSDAFVNVMSPSGYQNGILFGSTLGGINGSTRGGIIYNHSTNAAYESLALRTGGNINRMIIDKNGNVAIGDFMPQNKLDVNGTIRGKEVIVETGWADYVFEENYKLKSIEEMAAFINENKHLPNIPKASEIEKNGMKVGETNKAMMEKIEELALYIIQLKKEIDILKSKN
jgi:hypothetical protein